MKFHSSPFRIELIEKKRNTEVLHWTIGEDINFMSNVNHIYKELYWLCTCVVMIYDEGNILVLKDHILCM